MPRNAFSRRRAFESLVGPEGDVVEQGELEALLQALPCEREVQPVEPRVLLQGPPESLQARGRMDRVLRRESLDGTGSAGPR
jgi:hypothetical protein